jgi:hypothetical protein
MALRRRHPLGSARRRSETSIFQTLATGRRLLKNLADPSAQPMHSDRKQKFLNTFRDVLAMHAASGLDVVGFQAMGAVMKPETEEKEGVESENSAKWAKLMTRLDEKEELMRVLAEKVTELEADGKEKTELVVLVRAFLLHRLISNDIGSYPGLLTASYLSGSCRYRAFGFPHSRLRVLACLDESYSQGLGISLRCIAILRWAHCTSVLVT